MHCNNWIFDMDGTLTDSMTVVWEGCLLYTSPSPRDTR
mgnify:FL=1